MSEETKIANLITVREHTEGDTVELWINHGGRLVVRAFNECQNRHTDVDLMDLIDWLRSGTMESVYGRPGLAALPETKEKPPAP